MATQGTKGAHTKPGKVPIGVARNNHGRWNAAPPAPKVHGGDEVIWTFGNCNWKLQLPFTVFEKTNLQGEGPATVTAKVREQPQPGPHTYCGTCDGEFIEGNSPPSIIVE